jgi:large subunit ribosomal protein L20
MSRIKRSLMANKRRKNLLARAKGFKGKSGNIYRIAKERLLKAESNAYKSRRLRKRDFRSMWITRLNGALDAIKSELNYSQFINLLNKSDLQLNRKSLSEIAILDLNAFKSIVDGLISGKQTHLVVKAGTTATKESAPKAETKVIKVESKTSSFADVTTTATIKADDLKIVEGIGPAIEKLLHEAEIKTYEALSEASYDDLKKIMVDAGSRFTMHDPLNWSRQAKLAFEGKFDELETLKDELVKGK